MSLQGYTLEAGNFTVDRGNQVLQPETGSQYSRPIVFNSSIPTGAAERTFVSLSASVTIIDPNGEGTCKPRLVAVGSLSTRVINSTSAVAAAPFTSVAAIAADITSIGGFLTELLADSTIPAAS